MSSLHYDHQRCGRRAATTHQPARGPDLSHHTPTCPWPGSQPPHTNLPVARISATTHQPARGPDLSHHTPTCPWPGSQPPHTNLPVARISATTHQPARNRMAGNQYSLSTTDRLIGLVLRRPPRERKIPGSNPACAGISFGVESYR